MASSSSDRFLDNQNEILQFAQLLKSTSHHLTNQQPERQLLVDLLLAACSIDVDIWPRIVDWLAPVVGWQRAQAMARSALTYLQQGKMGDPAALPICFRTVGCYGVCVVYPTAVYMESTNPLHPEVASLRQLLALPCVAKAAGGDSNARGPTQTLSGHVYAFVRLGDRVQLRTRVKRWWTVHELRLTSSRVLLRAADSSQVRTGAHGHIYKEVELVQLLGCSVWRTSTSAPAPSLQALYARHESHLVDDSEWRDVCQQDHFTVLFQLPAPRPRDAVEQARQSLERFIVSHVSDGNRSRAIASRRKTTASKPNPFVRTNGLLPASDIKLDVATDVSESLLHTQQRALLHCWINRKDLQLRVRHIFRDKLSPSVCAGGQHLWLLVCRCVKAVCGGGSSLLKELEQWASAAPTHDGYGCETNLCASVRAAYRAMRVRTSCDHPAISRARAFLRCRGLKPDQPVPGLGPGSGSGSGSGLEHSAMSGDALARWALSADPETLAVMQAARAALDERALVFAEQEDLSVAVRADTLTNSDDDQTSVVRAGEVSVASYETQLTRRAGLDHGLYDNSGEHIDTNIGLATSALGRLLSVQAGTAFLMPGDVLGLPRSTAAEYTIPARQSAAASTNYASESRVWLAVLQVDLLWARLKVQPVAQPPPHCWGAGTGNSTSTEDTDTAASSHSHWLHIAALWAVPVCRQDIMPAADPSRLRFCVFVTPAPSAAQAVKILEELAARFPRR